MVYLAPSHTPHVAARILSLAIFSGTLLTGAVDDKEAEAPRPRSWGDSPELVAALRRQLMSNNYDYMSSESEQFPALLEQRTLRAAPAPSPTPGAVRAAPGLLPSLNDIYIPRAAEPPPPPPPGDSVLVSDSTQDSAASLHGLDKNELLYYMDEGRLSRRAAVAADNVQPPYTDAHPRADPTPTLKYKLLKVQAAGGARRAGGAYRRFIQEEGEGGVALINLGDEPFPDFRLPRARTQYMADGALPPSSADLEVALPSDLEGEPATRPP